MWNGGSTFSNMNAMDSMVGLHLGKHPRKHLYDYNEEERWKGVTLL